MSGDRLGSWLTLFCVALCLGPPLVVALEGLGAPPAAALAVTLAAIALLAVGWRRIPPLPLALARRHPAAAALWLLVLAAAAVGGVRASLYARDATQPRHSVDPGDAFRVEHCCMTAYAEAARFAAEGVDNPYARDLYRPGGEPRRLGPLTVDPFHYPPPFLLLPGAVGAVAPDFFDFRRVWFGLQALVLGAALLGLARWVGGEEGRRVALGAALLWALPNTFLGLQFGNFQLTAIPLALAGCWLGWSASQPRAGGALLAFAALGKVFPCLLALHVLGGRRWRFVAWLSAWGAAFALLTLALYGWAPFDGFFRHELPRLASGAAFPQSEQPPGILVNQSFYGVTTKLRALGLDALDAAAGKHLAQLYALLVATAAVAAGRRLAREGEAVDGRDRLRRAATWLAILNLASFAGPFVGGGYGNWGTLWLIVLLWALAASRGARLAWLAALPPVALPIFVLPSAADRPVLSTGLLLLALVAPLAGLALNAAALRLARRPAPAG